MGTKEGTPESTEPEKEENEEALKEKAEGLEEPTE